MDISEVLTDGIARVRDQVPDLVHGVDVEGLSWRPDAEANPIAWLVWHLTRVLDDHVATVAGTEQAWVEEGWADRFDLPFDVADHGFGHTSDEVGQVRVSGSLLAGYHAAVARRASAYVATLTPPDLDRVVDRAWNPPVTLGVRLVSVVCEINQHIGQAAYVRGMLDRRADDWDD